MTRIGGYSIRASLIAWLRVISFALILAGIWGFIVCLAWFAEWATSR